MLDTLVILQCFVHLPFLVMFHVLSKRHVYRNVYYMYMYLSNILFAFGFSKSLMYGTFASCINGFFLLKAWKQVSFQPSVQEVNTGVFVYIIGLLLSDRIQDVYTSIVLGCGAYVCTCFEIIEYLSMHVLWFSTTCILVTHLIIVFLFTHCMYTNEYYKNKNT